MLLTTLSGPSKDHIQYHAGVGIRVDVPTGVTDTTGVDVAVPIVAVDVGAGVPTSLGSPVRSSRKGCPLGHALNDKKRATLEPVLETCTGVLGRI